MWLCVVVSLQPNDMDHGFIYVSSQTQTLTGSKFDFEVNSKFDCPVNSKVDFNLELIVDFEHETTLTPNFRQHFCRYMTPNLTLIFNLTFNSTRIGPCNAAQSKTQNGRFVSPKHTNWFLASLLVPISWRRSLLT